MSSDYDVVVIGAGVSGCSVARELARYDLRVVVLERGEDVCSGSSKANSGIVHAGFDAAAGTLMARLNVEGAHLMPDLCEELGVDYENVGSLVVCTDPERTDGLEELRQRGIANGVEGLQIVNRERLLELEPNVSDAACAALWAPTAGIVNPMQLTVALAENAATNGVEFRLNAPARGLSRDDAGLWHVSTPTGELVTRVVVNAAGTHADTVHNMACPNNPLVITPRRGQYYVLDTTAGKHVRHTVFALPTALGKGILVSPTTGGNLLVGPTAEDIDDPDDVGTTASGLAEVASKCAITVKDVPLGEKIRCFSGLRAHRAEHDFLIGEAPDAPGFVDCAAIESPGLTSAPAIGRMVADIVTELLGAKGRADFQPRREPIPCVERLSAEEWARLIAKRPDYGRIVCRCRHVTEGQIVDAIHAPVGARSLDAVKRRTEAGMGRCQAGFCSPKVMEILAREVPDLGLEHVTLKGPGSEICLGHNKDSFGGDAA